MSQHGSDTALAAVLRLSTSEQPESLATALADLGYHHAHVVAAHELQSTADGIAAPPLSGRPGYLHALNALHTAIRPWLAETGVRPDDAYLWHLAFGSGPIPEVAHEWLRLTPVGWLAHAAGMTPQGYADTRPSAATLWAQVTLNPAPAAARIKRVIPILTDPGLLARPIEIPVPPTW